MCGLLMQCLRNQNFRSSEARSVKDFIELNILLNISGRRPSNCVTHDWPLVVYHFSTIKKYLKVS
jgi:hypothetical protein